MSVYRGGVLVIQYLENSRRYVHSYC